MIKKTFKLRLFLYSSAVMLVSFGVISFFLEKNLENRFLSDLKSSLIIQAKLSATLLSRPNLEKADFTALQDLLVDLSRKASCRLTLIDPKGVVLADSDKSADEIKGMENHSGRNEVISAMSGHDGVERHYSATLKINMLYVAVPLQDKSGIFGVLRMAIPLSGVEKALGSIRRLILFGFLLSLLIAFVLGSVFSSSDLRTVNRMIQVSRKFAEGDFRRRIIPECRDEIGELAVTLNKMAQDIEDMIREIKEKNQKFSVIFDNMREGVIAVDRSGRITSVNRAVEMMFGVIDKDIRGRFFLEGIRNNDISDVVSRALNGHEPVSAELTLNWPLQGTFQINATPVFEDEQVSGCLAVIQDITETRRLEVMRRDFVANVSHELKTPLTSIIGFVETLLDGALDDKENNREFLGIIRSHAQRLGYLVDDLLTLSCLESRQIRIEPAEFNLRRAAEEVILGFGEQLKRKGIKVNDELPVELTVRADQERLKQVFTNLIDNAIKFNKDKGVIKIYSQDMGFDIKVVVEDNGIGVPSSDLPRVFERFYRVDKARSRQLGGTGLGLSIVKHIIELHNGRIGAESAEGLGAKFWFILPK